MLMCRRVLFTVVVTSLMALGRVEAAPILFEATDLTDITPGQDRWEYRYYVEGLGLLPGQGFTIKFDPFEYADLSYVSSTPDWDVLIAQPVPSLPDVGLFDALALQAPPQPAPLLLNFTWLGQGLPGPQLFDLYELVDPNDPSGAISFLSFDNVTMPREPVQSVPEPSALMLVGIGAIARAAAKARALRA